MPQAAVTGDNTNRTNLNILNKGASGSGTTEVGNLDLATGTNLTAFDSTNLPLNATYVSGVALAEGDVVTIQHEKAASPCSCRNARARRSQPGVTHHADHSQGREDRMRRRAE
ncbi:MAG: hypothetical protein IPG71_14415 [bacterium]|nr:hypothetical protein [bacterium]